MISQEIRKIFSDHKINSHNDLSDMSKMDIANNILKTFKVKTFNQAEVLRIFGFNPKLAISYRIVILGITKPDSMFESFFENLRLAFSILGCHVNYIPWQEFFSALSSSSLTPIHEYLAACDFIVCGDCGMTAEMVGNIGIPSVSVGLDRPYIFGDTCMNNGIRNVIYTWVDGTDVPYAEKYYYKDGHHMFLPHSAEINLDASDIFETERFIDVLVSCNYGTISLESILAKDMPFDRETVLKIMTCYIAGGKTWEACVEEVAGYCTAEVLIKFMTGTVQFLEIQTRMAKRLTILKALLDGGVTVHCFGGNWHKTELVQYPNFLYYGKVDCEPGRELFKHAKILINISHIYNSGAHERIFSSMIRGAMCMAEHSEYLDKIFTDEKDIVFYDYKDLNGFVERVKYYLAHDEERLMITKTAFEKVRKEHTWLNRAADIIDSVKEHFFNGNT